jgi:hypothetical protein
VSERPQWEPVVSLDAGGGTTSVCRDRDGSLWLTVERADRADEDDIDDEDWDDEADLDDDGEFDPRWEFGEKLIGFAVASDDLSPPSFGGRVPPGAVEVELFDRAHRNCPTAIGAGVWVGVVERPPAFDDPLVVFRDGAGIPVAPPVAEGLAAEARPDLTLQCPGCGSDRWQVLRAHRNVAEEFTDPDDWPGGLEPGAAAVACAACGFQEALGVSYGVMDSASGREPGAAGHSELLAAGDIPEELLDDVRVDFVKAVRGARFPLYGLTSGAKPKVSSYGEAGGEINVATLDYEGSPDSMVSVTTSPRETEPLMESPDQLAEEALAGELLAISDPRPAPNAPLDEVHLALEFTIEQYQQQVAAARAPRRRQTIHVDGEPTPFLVAGDAQAWGAFAELGDVAVTIGGRRIAPDGIALQTVAPSSL